MTTLDATLSRIRAQRREVDWVKVGLTLAFMLPWAVAWVARKVVVVLGVVASFLWSAAVVGWSAAAPAAGEDDG